MDKQDLVLLIAIPLMLIGILIYTEKYDTLSTSIGQKITGFAASQEKQSNIIGSYFSNLSFRAKISYGLDDYGTIRESIGIISACTESGKHLTQCIDELNAKDKAFTWQLGCDKGAEKILYDFAEFLQNCIESDDNNCLCRKKMEIKKEDIQDFLPPTNEYSFTLTKNPSLRSIEISLPNFEGISYNINTNGLSGRFPQTYSIGYGKIDGALKFNLIFINEVLNTPAEKSSETFGPTNQITIYKKQLKDNSKAIEFVDQKDSMLIYPNGKIATDNDGKEINPKGLQDCQFKPKNIYKFCVTQNSYKVLAYDKIDGKVTERNPVIKFASYVPDLPPAPLKNLEAFDRPKAEKSVLLKWDKNNEKDTAKFRIYYADSSLKAFDAKISTEELRKNKNIISKEIDANAIEVNSPIKLDGCEFDFLNKKCLFPADIENNKIYYSPFFNAYVYSLNVPEDKKGYDISVTAVDKNNNEINNIDASQKLPIVENIQSTDDLPPNSENLVILKLQQIYEPISKKITFNFWEKPVNSIDGSPLNDFNNYKVYYLKYNSLAQGEKSNEINKILGYELKGLKFLANVNYEQQGQPFLIDISATNPESGNTYFFVIAAADINGNPKEEQFKVKELGANVLQLTVP
ncbi:hypothetical protein HYV80_01615 [Candidatus Woesearchaeota archaeon]|nr:hypothetical protein [Candidatus Woesearchaeota archaeon]